MYLCFNVFSNLISLSKLSVDVFDRFAFATHFMAKNKFVACNEWKVCVCVCLFVKEETIWSFVYVFVMYLLYV